MDTKLQEQLKQATTTLIITPEPLIMEKVGDSFRGVYLGLRTFDKLNPQTGELERKPIAHFYDGARVLFNMGAMLTRAVELLPIGMSAEIVLKELKANNKGGKTKIYSVAPLDIPRLDLHDLFGGILELTAPKPEDLRLPAPGNGSDRVETSMPQFANYAEAAAYVEIQLGQGAGKAFAAYLHSGGMEKFRANRDSHLAYQFVNDELTAREGAFETVDE